MTRQALRTAILASTAVLERAGVPSPAADAQELAAHLLGVPRTRLGLTPLVDDDWVESYERLIAQRAQRIPLQHLVGSVQLGGATVQVGPGVFIPRPETESLVEWSLGAVAVVTEPVVVDLCTGSAAIALAIAVARPDATVVGVERSATALGWARRNVAAHGDRGGSRVELRAGDVLDPALLPDLEGRADLVTANPPYLPSGTPLEPEVARHDPAEAVFAGPDGLAVIRPLITVAARLLRVGGVLAMEHDDRQGESVPALFAGRRLFAEVADHDDLTGRPRFVTARRIALAR